MTRETDLAWAAGFIDGDGCFSVIQQCYFRVTVTQVDKRPLLRLAKIFGVGQVKGPYARSINRPVKSNTSRYNWTVTGLQALRIYKLVEPYLSEPKLEQAFQCIVRINSGPKKVDKKTRS